MKKKLLIASALAVSSLGVAGTALATSETSTTRRDEFATKLADKFKLNKYDVTSFMSEQHEVHEAEMHAKASEALKAAGFTEEQITTLQNKKSEQRNEHKAWRDANPDATKEQRQAHRDTERSEFEAWASEQGIDLTKVRDTLKESGVGRGMHRGPRGEKGL